MKDLFDTEGGADLPSLDNLGPEVESAIQFFWETLQGQAEEQRVSANTTRGRRAQVLGGGQMDGFAGLIEDLLVAEGVPRESVKHDYQATLPGFFRHEKEWDTAVVHEEELLASIEYKSIASSFGNNLNNRSEEAIGSNTDLLEAYEEGVFSPSPQPFVGYLLLMADSEDSNAPVGLREPNFNADEEFQGASYARRAELLCLRMVRKRLVSGAAFLMSGEEEGLAAGAFTEPNEELRFERFVRELTSHVSAHL
ncbi:hypothetical protein GGQ02_003250 [Salinibacter ruber]|uniref:PaeR7I family type II restriction endonuclease n=1 Tax=Salinibacter ruber TaxID=146919 RepID=UPI0021688680|nr:PaeR7I family type II restriction endonuclease [Salinibacter ruber]MCS4034840.1 hypothetical protein [Salinibacter ruber]